MENLAQILLLLAVATGVIVAFQRLGIPTSLGYLLVGVILGPHTFGPTVSVPEFQALAEFGVVFLLFTIGLSFSIPQLKVLRHQVLGLGTGQVVITTLLVSLVLWAFGLPYVAAFVFGAVFAQSSTTIIASLLNEQGEENSQHGRLGVAMSVFQDVTAVPFLVVIPVLGTSIAASVLAGALGMAMAKAAFAFLLVFFLGRWLLRPLFHLVSQQRSSELFTLAVLLVALLAAWTTDSFGLSLAFGGFLAGMMLGETEFRHQVESTVRPFRDVLLGLFFVGIGMRIDLHALPGIWEWALLGALLMLVAKILIVGVLVQRSGVEAQVAWRTGLLLGVGGEFGLALVAIAIDAAVIDVELGQVAITSVLLAIIFGAVLIRFNGPLVRRVLPDQASAGDLSRPLLDNPETQVVIGGFGRVGYTVAALLRAADIPFIAFDANLRRVMDGRSEGFPVHFGDISNPELLDAIHIDRSALVVITVDDSDLALHTIAHLNRVCPQVPVIARARDLESSRRLQRAGAIHAYPETIEASLRLGETALQLMEVASADISEVLEDVRAGDYRPVLKDS